MAELSPPSIDLINYAMRIILLKKSDFYHNIDAQVSNSDKVNYVYGAIQQYDLYPAMHKDAKSDSKAEVFKKNGNVDFGTKKSDYKAFINYTKSITHATNRNNILSIAYANRAAVLLENRICNECLVDIRNAFEYEITDAKLITKLHNRQTRARTCLNENKERKIAEYFQKPPKISYSKNPTIDCASDCVKMEHTESLGRHIVATRRILPGDVIAVENPYAAILLPKFYNTNCFHCLQSSFNLIPCHSCTVAMFCSKKCRDAANKIYHEFECPILLTLQKQSASKFNHLVLRVVLSARNDYENIKDFKDSEVGTYQSERYEEIHRLATNQELRFDWDLHEKAAKAATLYKYLEDVGYFNSFPKMKQEEIRSLVQELLFRHYQTAPTNMHEIAELSAVSGSDGGYTSEEIGAGAYAFLSLLNHSCSPNVVRHCHGKTIVLRALRPIEIGEQLCDNYGYHHSLHTRVDRISELKSQYFFECNCEACIHDWPLYLEQKLVDEDTAISDEELAALSNGCRITSDESIPKLIKKSIKLENTIPSSNLSANQEMLKQCYAILGNKRDIF